MLNYWTTMEAPGRLSLRNWLLLILWSVQSIKLGTQGKPLIESKEKVVRGAHLWFPERWAPGDGESWGGVWDGQQFSDIGQPQYSSSWGAGRQCLGEPISPSSPDGVNVVYLLFSHSVMSYSLWPHKLQHTRLLCPPLSPGAFSNSCPLSQWCRPTISSSVAPFFSCPQSFPASGPFPVSQLFTSGGHSIGASASASVFQMNVQCWFPLGLIGLISLQSDSQESSPTSQFKSINSSVISLLYGPALTM